MDKSYFQKISTFFFNALLPVRLAAQEGAPCKENHEGEKEWDPKPKTQEALKDGDGDIAHLLTAKELTHILSKMDSKRPLGGVGVGLIALHPGALKGWRAGG